MSRNFRWPSVVLTLGVIACCPGPIRQLSGQWVFASPGGIGVAAPPSTGTPLAVASAPAPGAPAGCVPRAEIDRRFGKTCERHESEGGAQPSFELPSMSDDVPIGITPTPGEPIWYCDKHTVLRIVLQRCEATDTFRVSQIAVAIAKE